MPLKRILDPLMPVLLLACLCAAAPAMAAEKLRFVLGLAEPFSFEPGKPQPGVYTEIVSALARESKLDFDIQTMPFARVLAELQAGRADLAVIDDSPIREPMLRDYLRLVRIGQMQLSVWTYRTPAPDSSEELGGKRMGRLRGTCKVFEIPDATIRFQDLDDIGSGLRMLAAGRIDELCAVREAVQSALHAQADVATGDYHSGLEGPVLPFRLVLNKRNAALEPQLRRALLKLRERGEIAAIYQRYGLSQSDVSP